MTNELSATVYKNEYEKLLKTEPVWIHLMTTTSGNVWAYYFDIYVLNYWANKDECNQIWVNTTNGLWLLIVKSLK